MLAITTESQEVTVRCREETDKLEEMIPQNDTRANDAIGRMDEGFEDYLKCFFHQKYRTREKKGFNPIGNPKQRAVLDNASNQLAEKASAIIEEHRNSSPFAQAYRGVG